MLRGIFTFMSDFIHCSHVCEVIFSTVSTSCRERELVTLFFVFNLCRCLFSFLPGAIGMIWFMVSLPAHHLYNIGIKHGFPCFNICQVPREVLKTEVED